MCERNGACKPSAYAKVCCTNLNMGLAQICCRFVAKPSNSKRHSSAKALSLTAGLKVSTFARRRTAPRGASLRVRDAASASASGAASAARVEGGRRAVLWPAATVLGGKIGNQHPWNGQWVAKPMQPLHNLKALANMN